MFENESDAAKRKNITPGSIFYEGEKNAFCQQKRSKSGVELSKRIRKTLLKKMMRNFKWSLCLIKRFGLLDKTNNICQAPCEDCNRIPALNLAEMMFSNQVARDNTIVPHVVAASTEVH